MSRVTDENWRPSPYLHLHPKAPLLAERNDFEGGIFTRSPIIMEMASLLKNNYYWRYINFSLNHHYKVGRDEKSFGLITFCTVFLNGT